VKSVRRNTV